MSEQSLNFDDMSTTSLSDISTEVVSLDSDGMVEEVTGVTFPDPLGFESIEDTQTLVGAELVGNHKNLAPFYTSRVELEDLDSLLPLLRDLPGFTFENSTYHLRGPIPANSQQQLFNKTKTIGRLKLSSIQEYFAPSVLLRLGLLRHPDGSLFPSLHDLTVEDGVSFLESLPLFLSPSLRRATFSGINEIHEASLVTFLQTASQEVPDLSFVLQHNQLSQAAIEDSTRFGRIQSLHLINTVKTFDFYLIEALGHMEGLKELVFRDDDASTTYRSCVDVRAEEEKANLEMQRIAQLKQQELQEAAERLEELERHAEEARKVEEARLEETRRLKEIESLLEKVPHGQELLQSLKKERDAIRSQEEFERAHMEIQQAEAEAERQMLEEDASLRQEGNVFTREDDDIPRPVRLLKRTKRKGPSKRMYGDEQVQPNDDQPAAEISAMTSLEAINDIVHVPIHYSSPNPSTYSQCSSPELSDWLGPIQQTSDSALFSSLTRLCVTGSPVLVQDIVAAVQSDVLADVDLRVAAQLSEQYGIEETSKCVDLAAGNWFKSLRSFSFDVGSLVNQSTSVTLSKSAFKKLLRGPSMHKLCLMGWAIEELEASLGVLSQIKQCQIQTLKLPCHPGASGISLTRIGYIAKYCPELAILQCRLKHLSNVPAVSLDYPTLSDRRFTLHELTVANAVPHPKIERIHEVARYLDALFPSVRDIRVPEGKGQNEEQWELIGKVVRMLQNVRSDEHQFTLQEVFQQYEPGAFLL